MNGGVEGTDAWLKLCDEMKFGEDVRSTGVATLQQLHSKKDSIGSQQVRRECGSGACPAGACV